METLFRLLLQRSPVMQSDADPSIELAQNTPYQQALAGSLQSPDPRQVLKAATRQFITTSAYIKSADQLSVYPQLRRFAGALDTLERKDTVTAEELGAAIQDVFGDTAAALIAKAAYKKAVSMLKDSIVAIKQLPEEHGRPIEQWTNMLRDLEVVRNVTLDSTFPATGSRLRRYRRRSVRLPTQADLKSILNTEERSKRDQEERKKQEAEKRAEIVQKAELHGRLQKAVSEVMSLDNQHLESTTQKALAGSMPPASVQPLTVFVAEMKRKETLGQLVQEKARTEVTANTVFLKELITPAQGSLTPEATLSRQFFNGIGEFSPLAAASVMFRFKEGTDQLLSEGTRNVLKERGLDISTMPVDVVVARLRKEMDELSRELDVLTQGAVQQSFKKIGKAMVMVTTPKASAWSLVATGWFPQLPPLPVVDDHVPATKGSIAPAGVADLIVVKQHLTGYRGMDVAFIQNVLKGERKVRDHRRLRQTEEITFEETETTTSEERELESTDRFEMSREASTTITEDASLKAGLTLSGSYGPTVDFSASAEGSLSRSKQEATKTASKYSKDVTDRSSTKLTKRILQRSQLKVTNEVEEKNNFTLDNVGGAEHISGVYQWVEKIYEAQMYNYGMRMMYDFMVPEPGAFLAAAMQSAHAHSIELQKPIPFTLKPNEVTETNYYYWVHCYGAGSVQPPPEEFRSKSLDYHGGGGDDKADYTHSGVIQIDEGYKAVQATVGRLINIWQSEAVLDVVVGRHAHRFVDGDAWIWTATLDNETDTVPFGMKTWRISDLALAVELKCQRTNRAITKWQLETHAQLMDAYRKLQADYEAKLAELEVQAGVPIQGKNPAVNLELMKDELKKDCISIITAQHYDLFGAIQIGATGLPQMDLVENEAEGPYVRFFEQAFEWEHLIWVTYPYFWGRKSQWDERIAFEDADPLFNQFLKAGYCRVCVPVRPGFEGAVDHFTTFGEIWNGGPLPPISNPLYLPIADELAERLDQPGDEILQGDPWEVRVPTDLVRLRSDDRLPVWIKDANGNWIEQ